MYACTSTSYGALRGWVTATIDTIIILLLVSGARADVFPGQAAFDADRTIITMPYDLAALVFDTSDCGGCCDSVPAWRFIGSLKADSVIYFVRGQGGPSHYVAVPLTDSSQLEGVRIGSPDLVLVLEQINVIRLHRRFPGFNPEDTLKWDPIRLKWHHLRDMSRHYRIVFDDTLRVDSVVSWLKQVPGLARPHGIPKPMPRLHEQDSTGVGVIPKPQLEQGHRTPMSDPWVPNDSLFDDQWHLQEKDWSTGVGGITAACAWGLLEDYERGNVTTGIIEGGLDSTHPDLDWKVSNCAPGINSHATKLAGVVGAITNNVEGIAGVAPDALVYGYNEAGYWNDIRSAVDDSCKAIVFPYSFSWLGEDTVEAREALEHAYTGNATVVTPSGYMVGPPFEPFFSYPSVWDSLCISVGAHSFYGNRAAWSNYTCDTCPQLVDVVAPGVGLITTALGGEYDPLYSGTCPAAAIVSGIAALAYGYDPNITPELVEAKIEYTANSTDLLPSDTLEYGYGRVDAYEFMMDVVNTSVADEQRSTADSIPCIIITNDSLATEFETLADRKTRRGTWTEIVTVESISTAYQGEDLQAKVRACIEYYYQNKHLEWVILGGDGSVVPFRFAYNNLRGPGVNFICDYYYACLDGDWNYDGDTLYGEVEDSVDLTPEVAVGRLPFSSAADVANYDAKLDAYESADSLYWQGNGLFLGSRMFQDGDGEWMCQDLLPFFPADFDITEQYDGPGGTASLSNYFQAMNAGQSIVVKNGLADHDALYWLSLQGPVEPLRYMDVDTLGNHDKPSVIFSATCWNHMLDRDTSMANHYMNHPTGGAVAYIGTTYNDFVYRSHLLAREFFDQLFGSGPKEIGALLNLGKQVIEPKSHYEGAHRHTIMGYTLSGDPQMHIWTNGSPTFISQDHVDTVGSGMEVEILDSVRHYPGKPVVNATVCLMKDDEFYEVKYSDSNGTVLFTPTFRGDGIATIVASKHNYVYHESQIVVLPCCVWLRGNVDGDPYDDINIADQTYLIDFLFQGGPAPPCHAEGNVDGDPGESINVADLTYLSAYLFLGGPPPPFCP